MIRCRVWRRTASAVGLLLAGLLLASCGSASDPAADAPSGSETAEGVLRIAEPDPNCDGATPTSLSAAIDAVGTDCFYAAPATLTAEVPGEISLDIKVSAGCMVDAPNEGGSTGSSIALAAGEGVTLSDSDSGTCRFQVSWTPSAVAASTTTTVSATPTTSSTTTSTTTTTTTTTAPPPPPTTTSNVGS